MAKKSHVVSIRVPQDIYDALKKKAEESRRPMANLIIWMLSCSLWGEYGDGD